MDLSALTTALSGLKTATDIVRGINDLDRGVEVNGKVIELQQIILSLQGSLLQIQGEFSQMQQENSDLRTEVQELKRKNEFGKNYELLKIQDGVWVYRNKDAGDGEEHWLCTNCFGNKTISILQKYSETEHGKHYLCPSCDYRMSVRGPYR